MLYTIYKYKLFRVTEEKEKYWEDEYRFYQGDYNFDKDDLRIRPVPNQRKDIFFIGKAEIEKFPVQYPLKLTDGTFINKIENPITPNPIAPCT